MKIISTTLEVCNHTDLNEHHGFDPKYNVYARINVVFDSALSTDHPKYQYINAYERTTREAVKKVYRRLREIIRYRKEIEERMKNARK